MVPSRSDPGPYVFVSYASVDRKRALHIADLLETNGISVWIDRKSIAGGTSWSAEIVRGIRGCTVFLVVCSPAAMSSPNVQQEIQVAFESRHPIVPLLLERLEMPESVVYALAGRQWIEVLDEPEERWLPAALRALQGLTVGLVPRAAPPPLEAAPGSHAAHASAGPQPPPTLHNLPVEVTSFVGRERELQQVRDLLTQTHLLTLTGMGGCGKTRLALKLGETVLDTFADGVWLVELAPLSDPALIPQAVARAINVSEVVGRDLTSVLVDALRPRHLLLIVDNCEHLIAACATLIDTLARGCPYLRIVATSREILGAPGETVWRIPSLAAPDPQQLPGGGTDLTDLVAQSDAVRLFVERARQVVSGFQVTPANARALAQICHRLDGIPLALELAASRLRTISVDQLAARLDSRFRLLTGGSRTALRRQQTLRALVDWSYDLLSAQEQTFFRKLAVFVGGWQIEAAEAICGSDDGDADVLDLLAALADKSLVLVENNAGSAPRYRLLETLREYALERLVASEEAEASHDAHAGYYLALAEPAAGALLGEYDLARGPVPQEIENIRAALRWFAEGERWDECLRLTSALAEYWYFNGYLAESAPWLRLGVAWQEAVSPAARGSVLLQLGRLAFFQGDYTTARDVLAESARIFQERGDRVGEAWARIELGNPLREQGHYAEALTTVSAGLRLCQDEGVPRLVVNALLQLFGQAYRQGDLERASARLDECEQTMRGIGSFAGFETVVYFCMGAVAADRGEVQRAHELYTRSVSNANTTRAHLLLALDGFAALAMQDGKPERTLVLAGAVAAARDRGAIAMGRRVLMVQLEEAQARARAELGAAADKAWARGQRMTLDQAIAYALEEEKV